MFIMFSLRATASVLTGLTIATAATACSAGYTATPTATNQQVDSIVVGTSGPPASLDFTTTGGAAIPSVLMRNVYETLISIDNNGDITPGLATSWDVSPDGTVYTFHLRDGVTFSTGEPFTADTAAFSITRVKDAWTNGMKKGMDVVDHVRVIDPLTLEVTLSRPSNQWLWSMGTLIGAMMHPDHVDKLATDPVGTGPYTIDSFAVGQSVALKENPTYWGTKPHHAHAIIRYFADATSSTNALMSGDIDVLWAAQQPEVVLGLQQNSGYNVEVGTTNGEVLLSMNNKRAPFDDVRVRQAVMYAIDRQAVIDTAWAGYGTDTGGQPVPPTDPWYTDKNYYPYDPDKARELIREAGAEGAKVEFDVPSFPYAMSASEIIVSQLRDIGLDAYIVGTEFPAVWLNKVMGQADYQMSLIAHVEARDIPHLFGNPDYYLGYDSSQLRDQLTKADTGTPEENVQYMRDAVDTIMNDAAADTVFNFPNIVVTAPGVTGINPNVVTEGLPLYSMEARK